MLRFVLFLPLLLLFAARTPAAEAAPSYAAVEVAQTWTSIYVGTVSLRLPLLVRHGETYSAHYTARVIPYFFYNEDGTLTVDINEAQLAELAASHPIDFTGEAVRDDGVKRTVTGRATPKDATSGRLKVRVRVSKKVELVFNTTYQFTNEAASR